MNWPPLRRKPPSFQINTRVYTRRPSLRGSFPRRRDGTTKSERSVRSRSARVASQIRRIALSCLFFRLFAWSTLFQPLREALRPPLKLQMPRVPRLLFKCNLYLASAITRSALPCVSSMFHSLLRSATCFVSSATTLLVARDTATPFDLCICWTIRYRR